MNIREEVGVINKKYDDEMDEIWLTDVQNQVFEQAGVILTIEKVKEFLGRKSG